MDAGKIKGFDSSKQIGAPIGKAAGHDVFDSIGDVVGNATRAYVESPLTPYGQIKQVVDQRAQILDAASAYINSPLTGYGLAKRGVEALQDSDTRRHVWDAATLLNPAIAWGRGISSVFG